MKCKVCGCKVKHRLQRDWFPLFCEAHSDNRFEAQWQLLSPGERNLLVQMMQNEPVSRVRATLDSLDYLDVTFERLLFIALSPMGLLSLGPVYLLFVLMGHQIECLRTSPINSTSYCYLLDAADQWADEDWRLAAVKLGRVFEMSNRPGKALLLPFRASWAEDWRARLGFLGRADCDLLARMQIILSDQQ